jgi:hypothetical protein
MRLTVRTLLCLSPLALSAGALYLLTRADLAQPDPKLLTEPSLLTALDPSAGEEVRCADRRSEAKLQKTGALIDGRLTLRQAAARFRDINADLPDEAQSWRPPRYTEGEWPYRQVISAVHTEFAHRRQAPAQAEAWVGRLEAELRGQRRPKGAPRLHPDREPAGEPDR